MNVLMVGSEAAPFVKTGGLADVLGALPAALARAGEKAAAGNAGPDNIAVVLPRYRSGVLPTGPEAGVTLGPMQIAVGPTVFSIAIEEVNRHNVRYFFVDCPPLYDRPGVYNQLGADYPDNHIRFAALAQAALAIARWVFPVDVFHAHDWQGGLLGAYLRTRLAHDPTYFGARTVFTIHNLGYQGLFPASTVSGLGLTTAQFHPEGLEFWGQVNFLKAGIVWADAITTVSPTYAHEIQTPAFGFGLDGALSARAGKLTGILNGVDYEEWTPNTDPLLPAHYSAGNLAGKRECKRALLAEMGLPYAPEDLKRPLLGIVSRFATQKGLDLVVELGSWLAAQGVFLAVLGSGDAVQEEAFQELAAAYPNRFGVRIGYNNGLAHRIEGGSDLFLMPSRYEPCGLNQIYSLRYGTVPVVRATGGLDDTVDESTGFKFREPTALAFAAALRDALAAYRKPEVWTGLMQRGMARDFSWDASAKQYRELYQSLKEGQ
jgi:starch synthase